METAPTGGEEKNEYEGCEILSDDYPNYDLAFKVIVIGNSGKLKTYKYNFTI